MTLEQLRIFVAVAEREHVTRAARDLNLTQSAVSAAVSALEARHDTRLFDRIGRGIALTEAGRIFLVEAREVLARAAAAETVLAELAGLARGALSVAASQTVANYWLPPLLSRFGAAYPGVTLKVVIGNTETVAAQVREAAVDLGFVEGEVEDPMLSITPVAEDELALVACPRTAASVPRPVSPEDLRKLRWVFRERGSGTRALLEQALAGMGVAASELTIALELPSNEAVCKAVEAGGGAAALSRVAVSNALSSGALVELPLPLPARRFYALRRRDRPASRAESELFRISERPSAAP